MKAITSTHTITSTREWRGADVRRICIDNNLYSCGDILEYTEMLNLVDRLEPTADNIYLIAMDILEHSAEFQSVTNIMYILENDAVKTFYYIDGEEC